MVVRVPLIWAVACFISAGPAQAAAPAGDLVITALDKSGATRLPHGSVVMVWASWCVPCRTELKTFRKIAAAGAPLIAATLALDPADKATAGLAVAGAPIMNAFSTAADPATVLAALGGLPARLPLAFALDSQGHICGVRHGLLGEEQLRQWAAACSR